MRKVVLETNNREEKMKTRLICSATVLAIALGLCLGTGLVGADTPVGAPENELIIQGKKPARFSHSIHTGMGLECGVCHHDQEHNPLAAESIGALADVGELSCVSCHNDKHPSQELQKPKDIFHARCKTCHQEGYQGKKGPTKCTECHVKKNKGYEGC
jgi:hypothetical protein